MAKESGKLIFIDVYTTWCGPCRKMSATSFNDKGVGNVYNEKFINLKLDAENDRDGLFVSKAYRVKAYPTLLFIDGNGKLIKNFIGFRDADGLLNMAAIVNQ